MYQPRVSVIVNTVNRAFHLKRLLDCLSHQSYENFEVIVVNGPSTDATNEVLAQYKTAIRAESCPDTNLCRSRNIGVSAASGEILAFIDDDAVPYDQYWLSRAVICFADRDIGIAGGESIRLDGNYEFRYGKCSIYGDNIAICDSEEIDEAQRDVWYRGVRGNNMFVRREAMEKIGGFDEYYVYYLDESDLAIRIQQAGYKAAYIQDCCIIHEAAKGEFRKSEYDLNWNVILRSQGYFVTKFTENCVKSEKEREEIAYKSGQPWFKDFSNLLNAGCITRAEKRRYAEMAEKGLKQGIQDGLFRKSSLNRSLRPHPDDFLPFDKSIGLSHLNICYLCESDVVKPLGGSAVHTNALVYGHSKRGHNVYVITAGEQNFLHNVNGVNLCSVATEPMELDELEGLPTARQRLDFSYACFTMLQLLKKSFFIDIVETPIWDTYGLVSTYLEKSVPIVTRLQTPLKMVMETFREQNNSDLDMLAQFEAAMLEHSDGIITISDCVKGTIEKLYEMKFRQGVYKNYLGISPESKAGRERKKDGKLVVFFIGRLERRKGIDSIIASLPHLMEKYRNLEVHFAGDDTIVDELLGTTYKKKLLDDNKGAKWLKRVRFLGKISDEQKEQEFADCDVFVSPSLYESFGIIFIEAMRYAKPVIGCRAGGMQEVIADGETGLLSEPGNAESFCRCLDSLLADENMRKRMGEAGLKRFLAMFSEEVMCRGCEQIYREVIRGRKCE